MSIVASATTSAERNCKHSRNGKLQQNCLFCSCTSWDYLPQAKKHVTFVFLRSKSDALSYLQNIVAAVWVIFNVEFLNGELNAATRRCVNVPDAFPIAWVSVGVARAVK